MLHIDPALTLVKGNNPAQGSFPLGKGTTAKALLAGTEGHHEGRLPLLARPIQGAPTCLPLVVRTEGGGYEDPCSGLCRCSPCDPCVSVHALGGWCDSSRPSWLGL